MLDWDVELFMKRIGNSCAENAGDKFDTLQEVFDSDYVSKNIIKIEKNTHFNYFFPPNL